MGAVAEGCPLTSAPAAAGSRLASGDSRGLGTSWEERRQGPACQEPACPWSHVALEFCCQLGTVHC